MTKYPTVNYIGNKQKVIEWIYECIPLKNGKMLDLFSGGNSVSYYFKTKNFTVHSNDMLYSNYVLSKAIIENNSVLLTESEIDRSISDVKEDEIDKKKKELSFLANNIYFEYEVEELAKLVLSSENLKGSSKYLFLSLLRRAMIRKIPYSRMNIKWEEIQKFRDEEYSYKMYKRRRAYHNQTFLFHIKDNLNQYNNSIFDNKKVNKSYQCDALEYLLTCEDTYDLIYMDPPYPGTMNNYNSFYGYFDDMFAKELDKNIDLTNRFTFMEKFKKILVEAVNKTRFIAISLNNRVSIKIHDLVNFLESYGKVNVHELPHVYKVTGKENKKETVELLIVLEVKKVDQI